MENSGDTTLCITRPCDELCTKLCTELRHQNYSGDNNYLILWGTFPKWIKRMPSFFFFVWAEWIKCLIKLFGNLSTLSASSTICFCFSKKKLLFQDDMWVHQCIERKLNPKRNFHDSQERYREEQIEGERFNHTRAMIHAIYVKSSLTLTIQVLAIWLSCRKRM